MPRRLPKPLANEKVVRQMLLDTRADGSLGDLCSWELKDLEIPPEALRGHLRHRGLGVDWSPVPIQPRTAARKAISQMRPLLEDGSLKVLVRRVESEDPNEIRYALIEEEMDRAQARLRYTERNQIVFHTGTGHLAFTHDEIPKVRDIFDHLRSVYTAREVGQMTRNIIRGHGGVRLTDGTGMWFVPASASDVTDALLFLYNEDLVKWVGDDGRAVFRAVGVNPAQRSRDAVGGFIIKDLVDEVREAREMLWDAVGGDEEPHPTTVVSALERYAVLRGRLSLHENVLPEDVFEKVQVEIDNATGVCKQMLA